MSISYPSRVGISLLMYSEQCFVAVVSYATLLKSGEFDIVTVTTDIFGEDMDRTILAAYSGISLLYHNISTTVPVVTFSGDRICERDVMVIINEAKTSVDEFSRKRVIH